MKSAEFMLLITAIDELDHHQRKLLSAALNQLSDAPKVLEIIEASFDARTACPHCASVELYRHGCQSALKSIHLTASNNVQQLNKVIVFSAPFYAA